MRYYLCLFILASCLAPAWLSAQEPAATPSQDYAILIVGDEGDAEMKKLEGVLINEMGKSLRKAPKLSVPLYSYHFNKERERAYCEKKLNILREDLLFVGIVSLKDRVPRKVIYRLDRLTNPARSAADVVARADELAGGATAEATPTPEPAATPAAGTTPRPAGSPGLEAWRVQLGVFTQLKGAQDLVDRLKAKGYEAKVDKLGAEAGTQYKVWVGNFNSKADATQAQSELKNDGFSEGFVVEASKP